MESVLNITNGDCAVDVMKKANIPGVFLPWRDVLHDGPVPAGLSLENLSEVRANFIIECNWGEAKKIKRDFVERDNTLKSFEKYDKVILWFEHDLYDQLQLLQLLDWFNENKPKTTVLSIICVDKYLGLLSPSGMASLFKYEKTVTEEQLKLASKAWAAFRYHSPDKWAELLEADTSALAFLEGAVLRLLEEYPDCKHGLSRSALQALKIISQGERLPGKVFGLFQDSEERRFMGDSSFWGILHQLLNSSPPLIKLPEGKALTLPTSSDQELTITIEGKDVLLGKKNWLEMVNIDRWIGGVHLTRKNISCWDSNTQKITQHR